VPRSAVLLFSILIPILEFSTPIRASQIDSMDPDLRPGVVLGFDQALDEMTKKHSTVLVQKTQTNIAGQRVLEKKYGFLPTISVGGSQSSASLGSPSVNSISATANINLFRAGADFSAVSAASYDKEAEESTLEDKTLAAETESAEVLVTDISKRLQTEVLAKSVQTFQTGFDIAQQRYNKSILPLQEVDKLSVDLDNAMARLRDAQEQANTADANLVRLLGHEHIRFEWPWKKRLQSEAVRSLIQKEIPLTNRPDYKAALAQTQAEAKRTSQSYRTIFPSLDLSVSEGTSQYLGQSYSGLSGTVGLSMPLFNGLHDYAEYGIQLENQSASEIRLRQLERDIKSSAKAAQKNLEIALTTALAREKTLETSQRLYRANELRLKQGRASANELAVDQTRLNDSELLALQGWSDAHLAFVNLCHAFGRRVKDCD